MQLFCGCMSLSSNCAMCLCIYMWNVECAWNEAGSQIFWSTQMNQWPNVTKLVKKKTNISHSFGVVDNGWKLLRIFLHDNHMFVGSFHERNVMRTVAFFYSLYLFYEWLGFFNQTFVTALITSTPIDINIHVSNLV